MYTFRIPLAVVLLVSTFGCHVSTQGMSDGGSDRVQTDSGRKREVKNDAGKVTSSGGTVAGNGADAAAADVDAGTAGGSAVDGSTGQPTPRGTPVGPTETLTIGTAGGTFTSSDGIVTITFPAGALKKDTVIGIEPLTNTAPDGADNAYDLTADGGSMTFAKPVDITFQATADDLATASGNTVDGIAIAYQDAQGVWQPITDETRDATANTVSVSMMHFTSYAKYFWVPPPPPPVHYMINANFIDKGAFVCQIANADILDGFNVAVLKKNGKLTIPTKVTDRKTSVLNQVVSNAYPPGSTAVWTTDPEVFTSTSATVTSTKSPSQIIVTVNGTNSPGACTATAYGMSNGPLPGFTVAGLPVTIAFDPAKVPSSGTYDFPVPAPNNDWSFEISKF